MKGNKRRPIRARTWLVVLGMVCGALSLVVFIGYYFANYRNGTRDKAVNEGPQDYDAEIVSITGVEDGMTMVLGEQQRVSFRVRNTGTMPWDREHVKLSTACCPKDNSYLNKDRVWRSDSQMFVDPGDTGTFDFGFGFSKLATCQKAQGKGVQVAWRMIIEKQWKIVPMLYFRWADWMGEQTQVFTVKCETGPNSLKPTGAADLGHDLVISERIIRSEINSARLAEEAKGADVFSLLGGLKLRNQLLTRILADFARSPAVLFDRQIGLTGRKLESIHNPSAVFVKKFQAWTPQAPIESAYLVCFRYPDVGQPLKVTADKIGFLVLHADTFAPMSSKIHILASGAREADAVAIKGEDARLFWHHGKVFCIYNFVDEKGGVKPRQMRFVELNMNKIDLLTGVIEATGPIFAIKHSHTQKNWVPLPSPSDEYLLLVDRLIPTHAYKAYLNRTVAGLGRSSAFAYPVIEPHPASSNPGVLSVWQYGHVRGGSGAVKLNKTHALAVFHSSSLLRFPRYPPLTYTMGVLIFEVGSEVKITGISRGPIVGKGWYEGNWTNEQIDYVIYPGGVHIVKDPKTRSKQLVLFYGRADYAGWVCKLDLREVLSGLITFP